MKFKNIYLFLAFLIGLVPASFGQDDKIERYSFAEFHLGLGYHIPLGEFGDRYGSALGWAIGGEMVTSSHWILGGDFNYMFGDNINEDPISSLRTPEGFILGSDNQYADIFLRFRGIQVGVYFGKIFSLSENNKSGIRATQSIGILQHNFRFLDETNAVFQLKGDYAKGYDRLTRGLSLKQFIGWQNIDNKNRLNFIAGFEFTEAFTKDVRGYNINTQSTVSDGRLDLMVSLKIAWVLPFYNNASAENIFY